MNHVFFHLLIRYDAHALNDDGVQQAVMPISFSCGRGMDLPQNIKATHDMSKAGIGNPAIGLGRTMDIRVITNINVKVRTAQGSPRIANRVLFVGGLDRIFLEENVLEGGMLLPFGGHDFRRCRRTSLDHVNGIAMKGCAIVETVLDLFQEQMNGMRHIIDMCRFNDNDVVTIVIVAAAAATTIIGIVVVIAFVFVIAVLGKGHLHFDKVIRTWTKSANRRDREEEDGEDWVRNHSSKNTHKRGQ